MMQAIELPSLAEQARTLPASGAARDRHVHRLIDLQAAADAAAALRTAAARSRQDAGVLATTLLAADTLFAGAAADRGLGDPASLDRLRDGASSVDFLLLLPTFVRDLRQIASERPDTGACTVATAIQVWSWTMTHFRTAPGAAPITAELAEALCPLLAARELALEIAKIAPDAAPADFELRRDLCHVYAARVAAQTAATCSELVFGHRRHLVWDAEGCASCYQAEELDGLEAVMPGISCGATDVIDADGSHPAKEGPCVRLEGLESFMQLRNRLDGCLTGARIAKDRAAAAIARAIGDAPSEGSVR